MKTLAGLLTTCTLLLLDIGAAIAQSALERARRDEIVSMSDSDPAMAAAFAKARAGLDGFLALLDKPPPDTRLYAVKLLVRDGEKGEYFWVTDLARSGDRFTGQINNTPRSVTTVREGQVMTFGREEIRDWMYVDDRRRRMVGNFTLCALLTRESRKNAEEMKRATGLVCD
ncbi:MAG: DUF2314 domain-containing protein [Alphaproteobacteria bacterium]|nr:DUF2314 domain-containing protein [Alphaproteobacteria bacterium]MCW5741934.1 DUF2314 domain-containing protein [Alphaproteobacteria bacterium]